MDGKILKCITNCDLSSSTKSETSHESVTDNETFPLTKNVAIDELSKTLTRLLSYKVSKEAYQRYSVRLNVIDNVRDWCRVKGKIGNLSLFHDTNRSYEFLLRLLKKYLTQEVIDSCNNVDNLVQIAEVLLYSFKQDRSVIKYFGKVILQIISMDQTKKSEEFLKYVISHNDDLRLESHFIEKIYICQKIEFIEKPFTDCFVTFCSTQNEKNHFSNMDLLFKNISNNPLLFQVVANKLKEFFVKSEYSQISQDFIQCFLKKVEAHCNKTKKDTLELYPTDLQACVTLLRIKPSDHTEFSKEYTEQCLKEIFLKDCDNALILVSHFPAWLSEYLEFFQILDELTLKSNEQSDDES